jgi:hypothetical protein
MHPAAVRCPDKNEHVRNPVRQIIDDLTPPARLAGGERNHSIKHVAPEPEEAKQRRGHQKERMVANTPETDGGEDREAY